MTCRAGLNHLARPFLFNRLLRPPATPVATDRLPRTLRPAGPIWPPALWALALRRCVTSCTSPASRVLPEPRVDPYDLINSDDQELKVTLKSSSPATTAATLALWCVDCDKSSGTTETVDQWLSEGSDGHFGQTTQGLTYWQAKSLDSSGITTFTIARHNTPVAEQHVRLFGVGQLKGTTVVEMNPPTRVRFVPRPNLLRILDGNLQVSVAPAELTTELTVGVYRQTGTTLSLQPENLMPIPGVTVRFHAKDQALFTLLKPGESPTEGVDTIDTFTGSDGVASARARIRSDVVRTDIASRPSYGTITGTVTSYQITAQILDGDLAPLPVERNLNERVSRLNPETYTEAERTMAAHSLCKDGGNWTTFPQDIVAFDASGVVPLSEPRHWVTVSVYMTEAASQSIRNINKYFEPLVGSDNFIVTNYWLPPKNGPSLDPGYEFSIALNQARHLYQQTCNLGVVFEPVSTMPVAHPVEGETQQTQLVVAIVSYLVDNVAGTHSNDIDQFPSRPTTGSSISYFNGSTAQGFVDFAHNEDPNLFLLPRPHSVRVYAEGFAWYRRFNSPFGEDAPYQPGELGAILGRILSHEVAHNLGLVAPQLLGDPAGHTPKRADGVDLLEWNAQVMRGTWRLDSIVPLGFEHRDLRYLELVLPRRLP